MNSRMLISAIGCIDDQYIMEADPADGASPKAANATAEAASSRASRKAIADTSRTHGPSKKTFKAWMLAPVAASLMLVTALAVAVANSGSWFDDPGNGQRDGLGNASVAAAPDGASDSQTDTTMRGLPVENFSLANVQEGSATAGRLAAYDFDSLLQLGLECLAVVKVEGIQTVKADDSSALEALEYQTSDVRLLQSIYGDPGQESFQVSQPVIKGHFCYGTTNLLRVGAAYILPLEQYDGAWRVVGDMDVLFELDENGKVWSHSGFEGFNRYDGSDADSFIAELQALFSNDDFLLVNSPFGRVMQNWTLADITVIAKSSTLASEYGEYYNYSFSVNEVLSEPYGESGENGGSRLGATGDIMVYVGEDTSAMLMPGNRYLIFLSVDGGKIYTGPRMVASVDDALSIKAVPPGDNSGRLGESVFAPYSGFKIADVKALIPRVKAWQESH